MADNSTYENLPQKQQEIISVATELFHKHGIRRVTVKEICKNAGVSTVTCYKYFSNKWDIARAILEIVFEEGEKYYQNMLEDDISFVQKIENMLVIAATQSHAFSSEIKDDILQADSPLRAYALAHQKKFIELQNNFLKKAQKDGHIPREVEIPFMLFMLDQYCDSVNNTEFAKITPDLEDRANELAKLFARGFLKNP